MEQDGTPLAEAPAAEDLTTKIENPNAEPVETKPEGEKPEAAETVDTEGAEGDEPKKRVPGSQRLKNRLRAIEADYLTQQSELETYRQREREREQSRQENPQGRPGIDRAPQESDYPNDWFAFQEAKQTWAARSAVREEFNRVREEERRTTGQRAQMERRNELLETYHEYAAEVRERIPDFDKVVQGATSVNVKQELIDEIMSSDKSALLQYHLAKNPDKARELNELSGRELAREIGRLEARVHLPAAKRATDANAPPTEIKGGASPPVDPRTGPDDMNAYAAWRKKQDAARASR